MKRKFSEGRIVASLVAMLVLETVLLLLHLGVVSFRAETLSPNGVLAGRIVKTQNELRRRNVNSLVWEKTEIDEPVYFHDSVLTLAQSTATLELSQSTEVTLSENTLVTIEPPDQREHGEIRLKFVKGNLQARNPFRSTQIAGSEWTVDLHQGSEVEFRQTGDQNFELQVKKGEALFKSESGAENKITPSELLRIADGGKAETMAVDQELAWEKTPPQRIYAHEDHVTLPLKWQGHATSVVLQSLGHDERILSVDDENGGQKTLELPVGQHKLYLREAGHSSPPLNIQVWRAPVIHLLRPLPRDRVRVDEPVSFVWMQVPGVRKFQLDLGEFGTRDVQENSASAKFSHAGDVQWSVHGWDADGYEIPPLYSNPIYIRDNPLAPPRLHVPQLRKPASAGSDDRGASFWLWRELWPEAAAEEPSEAVFEWEPVEGADQYILEISATADFREPVLTKTLSKPRYVWRGFAAQAYYWRVAAGTKQGRMGVFSEPAQVNLQDEASAAADGVAVRKVAPPAAVAKPVAKVDSPPPPPPAPVPAAPPAAAVPIVEEKPVPPPPFKRLLAWSPRYISAQMKAKEQVTGKLNGGTSSAAVAEIPWHLDDTRLWQFSMSYASTKFRPQPASEYPFQGDLNWTEASFSALYYKTWWGYGAEVRQVFAVKRAAREAIKGDSSIDAGLAVGTSSQQGRWQWKSHASLLAGSQSELSVGVDLRFHAWGGLTIGAGAEEQVQLNGSAISEGALLLGFDF